MIMLWFPVKLTFSETAGEVRFEHTWCVCVCVFSWAGCEIFVFMWLYFTAVCVCMCMCGYMGVFFPAPLSTSLMSGCCWCQHTAWSLGNRGGGGRHSVSGVELKSIAFFFFVMLTTRQPDCTYLIPPAARPSLTPVNGWWSRFVKLTHVAHCGLT